MNGTRRRGGPRKRQRGFTLVELLVVITILGMLMAMMFPALGAVLETVRLSTCKTNLRTLGQALTTYTTNFGHWPTVSTQPVNGPPANKRVKTTSRRKQQANRRGSNRDRQKQAEMAGYSWIFSLLPQLGEETMHRNMVIRSKNMANSPFNPDLLDDDGTHLATKQFKALQCASFTSNAEVENTSMAEEYREWADNLSQGGGNGVGLTNYVAMSATHMELVVPKTENPRPNGVIYYNESGKGPSRIQDGNERTIVLVETREPNYASWLDGVTSWVVAADPNNPAPIEKDGSGGQWECSKTALCQTALNVGPDTTMPDAEKKINYRDEGWGGQKAWQYGPSSQHSNFFVNHLLASGTPIHFISHGAGAIDPQVYMDLVTRGGGESTAPPQ